VPVKDEHFPDLVGLAMSGIALPTIQREQTQQRVYKQRTGDTIDQESTPASQRGGTQLHRENSREDSTSLTAL
jgi:hypothetical protein